MACVCRPGDRCSSPCWLPIGRSYAAVAITLLVYYRFADTSGRISDAAWRSSGPDCFAPPSGQGSVNNCGEPVINTPDFSWIVMQERSAAGYLDVRRQHTSQNVSRQQQLAETTGSDQNWTWRNWNWIWWNRNAERGPTYRTSKPLLAETHEPIDVSCTAVNPMTDTAAVRVHGAGKLKHWNRCLNPRGADSLRRPGISGALSAGYDVLTGELICDFESITPRREMWEPPSSLCWSSPAGTSSTSAPATPDRLTQRQL